MHVGTRKCITDVLIRPGLPQVRRAARRRRMLRSQREDLGATHIRAMSHDQGMRGATTNTHTEVFFPRVLVIVCCSLDKGRRLHSCPVIATRNVGTHTNNTPLRNATAAPADSTLATSRTMGNVASGPPSAQRPVGGQRRPSGSSCWKTTAQGTRKRARPRLPATRSRPGHRCGCRSVQPATTRAGGLHVSRRPRPDPR